MFHPAFSKAFPTDVLNIVAGNCIVVEDDFHRINYAFGHFNSEIGDQEFMFEICLDLNSEGKLEIYDLSDDGVVIPINQFVDRVRSAEPMKTECVTVD